MNGMATTAAIGGQIASGQGFRPARRSSACGYSSFLKSCASGPVTSPTTNIVVTTAIGSATKSAIGCQASERGAHVSRPHGRTTTAISPSR